MLFRSDAEKGERRERRGEDYRGRGGGAGRRLSASFLGMEDVGMEDVIHVMGGGRGGSDLQTSARQTLIW